MTITAQTSLSGPYAGNGITDTFAYAFKVLDEDHLIVTLEDSGGTETVQTITTHYTVTGVGDAGGGNVVMVTPPASGENLTITRSVPKTQETDLLNRRSLAPEVLEAALDKLTQIAQDYDRDFDRTILTAVTSGITGLTLPDAVADQLIGWNGTADDLKNFTPNGSGYISVTASTDNAVARYDGTGGVGFQNSGVIIDDSDNVTGIADLTITGDFAVTGVVEIANGTVAAPGLAFASDLDTGIYRIGANNVGVAVGGAKVIDVGAAAVSVDQPLTVNGVKLVVDDEVVSTVKTLTSATSITVTMTDESVQYVELDHNATFTIAGDAAGQWCTVIIKQGSSGGTGAWSGVDIWMNGGTAPTLSTTTGEYDIVSLFVLAGTVVIAVHTGP